MERKVVTRPVVEPLGNWVSIIFWMGWSCGSSTCINDFWQLAARRASKSRSEQQRSAPRRATVRAAVFSCAITNYFIQRLSGFATLIHDLEAVFLDHRIGKHFLGNALELLLRFLAVPAIQIEDEEFSLAYAGNLRVTQAGKSVLNGLTLRVQNSAFRHNPNVCFHGPQYSNSVTRVHAGLREVGGSVSDCAAMRPSDRLSEGAHHTPQKR